MTTPLTGVTPAATTAHLQAEPAASTDSGLSAFMHDAGAFFTDSVAWGNSALQDVATFAWDNPLLLLGAAALLRSASNRNPTPTVGAEARAQLVLQTLKTPAGKGLEPLHQLLADATPKTIYAPGRMEGLGGEHKPFSFMMRGTPVTFSGAPGFQDQLLLRLAEAATGTRYGSVQQMHAAFTDRYLDRGTRFQSITNGETNPYSRVDHLVKIGSALSAHELEGRGNPAGYYFRASGYYVTVKPHNVQGEKYESVTVQITARPPVNRQIEPRGHVPLTLPRGPEGKSGYRLSLSISGAQLAA
jgi:hypothetical protein